MAKYKNMQERLQVLSVLDPETGCWLWLGKIDPDGYGRMNIYANGKTVTKKAHRVSYETHVGPIPDQHDLDHDQSCPRNCIAPDHLTPMHYKPHRAKTGFPIANPPK